MTQDGPPALPNPERTEGQPQAPEGAHLDPIERVEQPATEAEHLAQELAAERAGTAYWRNVARQRRIDAARVQKRPLVRAAIAIDRRTARLQAMTHACARRWTRARARLDVRVRAAIRWPQRRHRQAHLAAITDEAVSTDPTAPPAGRPDRSSGAVLEIVLTDHDLPSAQAAVDTSSATYLCLRVASVAAVAPDWLDALVAPLVDAPEQRLVTTPQVIHPDRSLTNATPHDLLVRWEGLDVELVDDCPQPRARRCGLVPDPMAAPTSVEASGPSALAIRRQHWDLLGGLAPGLDASAALVELSLRARDAGGTVLSVPAALVRDDRPVDDPGSLHHPFETTGTDWRAIVDRHGPALVRRARATNPEAAPSIAITTATPSRKIADRSGDWHFANSFATALRRVGHRVRVQTIEEAEDLAGRSCDLHLVLRGLEPVRRSPGQTHVLWVISHPEALDMEECHDADLVLVASPRFAAHLRERTRTPVEVLLQATDPIHFARRAPDPRHQHPVTVVANSRGVARGAVSDAVAGGLRPAIYGTGWAGLTDPALVVSEYSSYADLPLVYASADVVLNDHWETMRRWGFLSNRIFDVLATGTTVVSDHLPEITELFDDLVPTWHSPGELRAIVDGLGTDPEAATARTEAARARVLAGHTFDHRVAELHRALERHGLTDRGDLR